MSKSTQNTSVRGKLFKDFESRGLIIISAQDMEPLEKLRDAIFAEAKELLGADDSDVESFFNNFHKRELESTALNDFRMALISRVNEKVDIGELIFDSVSDTMTDLYGPDIAMQKSTNIVIHQPGDKNIPSIHRDSPPSSNFETVVWVPLVHCFKTKGLMVLDRENSIRGTELLLSDEESSESDLEQFTARHGENVDMKFGQVLIFWGPLLHDVPINMEDQTRWSLNLRCKNMFSPYDLVEMPEYYRVLRLSPLSRLAVDMEKERFVRDLP